MVKPGYKQTEVGVIPEDWESVKLGDLFKFKNGLNKGIEFFGQGTPIVNYMDVYSKSGIYFEELKGLVTLSKDEINNYVVRKGDVFFTRTSETPEEVGIASVMLNEPTDTVFSGFILRARPIDGTLDDQFKRYCFAAFNFRKNVISKSSYTTRALTNGRSLSEISILRPPLIEQEAIASALSDVDALIESLERLIAKKRDIKQAAMQELLTGKKRLPGFEGEWEIKGIGEVLSINHGKCQIGVEDKNGKYPILATGGQIGTANSYLYDKPSVLIGRKGTIDRPQYMEKPFWTVDTLFYSIIIKPNCAKFLFYLFHLIDWKRYNEASGVPSLNAQTIEQIEIKVPGRAEQEAIAALLSDIDVELIGLENKLAKTRLIKQGMMQELLTGRIRLV